ncbi:response regulator receiver modulated diguanylate cyclase/phosphodiesterase with PAS/PAC sensor(s) [Desulfurivibrio alkaliphilus AHT 2]|uniref:Response regulator receiver modulated diguanylate cyclase/phosphodiesterase with PAS/PAC sensor(S) n=2 Tax=Desulfurivibrio alkaliphilus TaxID=427923 RepID=D6Z6N6_DESAT|nr:response regulator receiver modulated diguanylate cyclase/phosphodiesterase with PAS/PAC sensor(s) [Desulfurivibrio alkaliphilus AHT 2]
MKGEAAGEATGKRILYLEDNPMDVDLTRRTLARLQPDCRLQVAGTVAEALELLAPAEPPYDVVLLDLRLPDGSGLEVLSAIRARKLPLAVVVLTGSGSRDAAIAALQAGADNYLVKQDDYLERLPSTLEFALEHFRQQGSGWSRALRVLYAEHKTADAELVQEHLAEHAPHVSLERFSDGAALLARLSGQQGVVAGDVLLLDFDLPDIDALEVVKRLREEIRLDVPVVLIGNQGSEHEVAEAMGLGVADYLIKQSGYLYGLPNTLEQVARLAQLQREQAALRASEQRHRLLAAALDASRDGMVITDLKGKIVAINPAFTTITGYCQDEALGKNPRILQSGRHDRAFYQAMWASLKKNGHWQGEVWNRRKNGEIYPELLSISTVYDDGGQPAYYVGVKTDLTSLRRSEEQLQYLAHHDPLTGLPNRLLLEARLEHGLERARREGGKLAVMVINLDRFRTINDSLGYAAGDRLLEEISQRLRDCVRAEDTLARLAGDEFALVLEMIHDYREAEIMGRRLQQALDEPFTLPDEYEAFMHLSIGISVYPQDGDTVDILLRGADIAVGLAKEGGGGQVFYTSADLNSQARRTLELEGALRRAQEQGEFLLYYQPKVDLHSGRVVGVEALLRWRRPGHGLVSPGEFIPVAERSGLIADLGTWVIHEACRQIQAWREAGLGEVRVAVNVSARQFNHGDLKEILAGALKTHDVKGELLTLELTESMLMLNPEEAITRMATLKELGVKLALDDFGTGFSSFSSLSRFPIDQLKIDRSFVAGLAVEADASTIAVSIIAMAHRMGLKVVAEGVETEVQSGYLRQNGCEEMQGFLFSKPLPAEELAELLRQGRAMEVPEVADEQTLLIVDDEINVLKALQRLLLDEGYRVLTAPDAATGLELLARHRVQVIISDQRMPGMRGIEFLSRVKEIYPDTVRMVLSGYADLETVVEAVNEGALYKFLAKPWKDDLLLEHIREAFLYYQAVVRPRQ